MDAVYSVRPHHYGFQGRVRTLANILDRTLRSGRLAIISLTLLIIGFVCPAANAQSGEWTWQGGNNTVPSLYYGWRGTYGKLGTPAAGNLPGGRFESASWTDSSGNLWLFGGYGLDSAGNWGYLNDLWEFNPSPNPSLQEWAWMTGSSTLPTSGCGSSGLRGRCGVYGKLTGNLPGGRFESVSWTDSGGNLWLFGGWGIDSTGKGGELNDLWEFSPVTNEWAWIAGSSTMTIENNGGYGRPGVYGLLNIPAAGNVPGGRDSATGWTDSSGNIWLFGGEGYDSIGNWGLLNDLWKFNLSAQDWTWVAGSNTVGCNGCASGGLYGVLNTPTAATTPGGRNSANGWIDSSGNLWLFGGYGSASTGKQAELNDLWQFSPVTRQWTWVAGSGVTGDNGQPGVYGNLGTASAGSVPGGRDTAAGWTDSTSNFWLFGGEGSDSTNVFGCLNDLWEFNPYSLVWAWMGGSSTLGGFGRSGVYGKLNTAAVGNVPGGRYGAASWTDHGGNFWLFGGWGYDSKGAPGYLNDLWEYQPAVIAWPAATPTFNPTAGIYDSAQVVTISDVTPGAAIYYTMGTTPSHPVHQRHQCQCHRNYQCDCDCRRLFHQCSGKRDLYPESNSL
jgi:N-acetylneuraminic acid mutarotase